MDYPILNTLITGMSRGRIVVDEQLEDLVPLLKDKNIRVQVPQKGQTDEFIRDHLIGNRIFITNNSKDFKKYAAESETWIIATENVRSKMSAEELARLISDTLRNLKLFSKPVVGGLLITLHRDKDPEIEKIEN